MSAASKTLESVEDLVSILNLQVDEIKYLRQSTDGTSSRLDGLLHLMSDMVKMEDQIRKMEENIERRLARMEAAQGDSVKLVDRLIEMTLVQAGQPDQAVLHRAQSRLENNNFFSQQAEPVEDDEDVWPPPGCDAMESRG